jgi:hypothetical protein
MSKVNDYDYNKMIEEFKLLEKKDKKKKERVIFSHFRLKYYQALIFVGRRT